MFFPSNEDVGGAATLERASPALLQTPGPSLSSPRPALASGSGKGRQTPWGWRMLQIVEETLQATAITAVDYVRSTRAKGLFFDNDVIKTNGAGGPWMQQTLPVSMRMLGTSCLGGKQGVDSRRETSLPAML